jgi:D-threo-aldose 1-dehydrogenase
MPENTATHPSSRRTLGGTGLSASPLCIGCVPLGDMSETFGYSVGRERTHDTLRAVFNSPINSLDTATSYDDGESERSIGEVLREVGRYATGC